jgi:DNA-directed RNA polymerase subunit F
MILSKQPLTLGEVKAYLSDDDKERQVYKYVKAFAKHDAKEAKALKEKLVALNNIKLKEADIVKLVDVSPQDVEGVHKVCHEAGLSEEECQAILGALK